jgi:hypothetical protein
MCQRGTRGQTPGRCLGCLRPSPSEGALVRKGDGARSKGASRLLRYPLQVRRCATVVWQPSMDPIRHFPLRCAMRSTRTTVPTSSWARCISAAFLSSCPVFANPVLDSAIGVPLATTHVSPPWQQARGRWLSQGPFPLWTLAGGHPRHPGHPGHPPPSPLLMTGRATVVPAFLVPSTRCPHILPALPPVLHQAALLASSPFPPPLQHHASRHRLSHQSSTSVRLCCRCRCHPITAPRSRSSLIPSSQSH